MHEIDLHDMNYDTALKIFVQKYNHIYRSGYKGEIKIIHGYGSGSLLSTDIIRTKIRQYLNKNKNHLKIRLDMNPGATYVTPLTLLPIKKNKKYF